MRVNSNPTVSQQNKKKLPFSKLFSFIKTLLLTPMINAWKLVTCWLVNMRENWLLDDWAWERNSWENSWENHFSAPYAFSDFFLCSPCHPFLCPLPLSRLMSRPCLTFSSLSSVLCHLSYFSVPCLPCSVPCLTFLSLASHLLSTVVRLCSLPPV